MSGVIFDNGEQYERCNVCGEYTLIETLYYEYNPAHPEYDKIDVCPNCHDKNKKENKQRSK